MKILIDEVTAVSNKIADLLKENKNKNENKVQADKTIIEIIKSFLNEEKKEKKEKNAQKLKDICNRVSKDLCPTKNYGMLESVIVKGLSEINKEGSKSSEDIIWDMWFNLHKNGENKYIFLSTLFNCVVEHVKMEMERVDVDSQGIGVNINRDFFDKKELKEALILNNPGLKDAHNQLLKLKTFLDDGCYAKMKEMSKQYVKVTENKKNPVNAEEKKENLEKKENPVKKEEEGLKKNANGDNNSFGIFKVFSDLPSIYSLFFCGTGIDIDQREAYKDPYNYRGSEKH